MGAQIRRFDFGILQDFRDPVIPMSIATTMDTLCVAEDIAPPPPPVFSESELEAAKKLAFEQGRQIGVREEAMRLDTEENRRAAHMEQACDAILKQSLHLQHRHHEFMRMQTEELSALSHMLARKLVGDVLSVVPHAGIAGMVEQCLHILQEQPRVTLMVHPDLTEPMDAMLAATASKYHLECEFGVEADANLAAGEARLHWHDGHAERRMETLWKHITSMLEQVDFAQIADASVHVPLPTDALESKIAAVGVVPATRARSQRQNKPTANDTALANVTTARNDSGDDDYRPEEIPGDFDVL